MNRLYSILALLLFSLSSIAQLQDPVDWSYKVSRISDTEAELLLTATIDKGWHVYSTNIDSTSAVYATEVSWDTSSDFTLNMGLLEPEPIEEYDPNFEEVLKFHSNKVTFRQKILIHSSKDFKVTGELVFMTCNDRMCLPPEYIDLEFKLKGAQNPIVRESLDIDYTKSPEDTGSTTDTTAAYETAGEDSRGESRSLIGIFLLCLAGGFAALLTPCVFPMIPMTVSFFTKQSKSRSSGIRNAFLYGFSIVLIYVLLSVPFHVFSTISPSILNEVSTNVYLNIFFFIVFVIFAISFFGAFEITLPNSWINKADRASDVGGLIGIFFMALTLVLVSFSCTGPLLGALLGSVLSTDGGASALTAGMAGFGVGLALPFGLFAAFPSWLNSIPKSGGWLNSVKVVLGFLELALAFKFLSNADLVVQTGILQREIFLTIWIAIFAALTLYLFGLFRLPHDSPLEKISVPRLLMSIFSLMFTLYLLPGLWGAPLKLISGFPPPMFYSESPNGVGGGSAVISSGEDIPEGADPEHCPHSLNCFHDFETGLAYAKEVNKPVLLDFTGWACVNCRKMEEQVWSDPRVLDILRNDVVLISLYVDDRTKLPENERYVSETTGKKVKTIGNKWSEFQVKHFKSNSQPQYILLGHDSMQPLNGSTAYDPDIQLYIDWLENGIARFEAGT